MLKNVKLFLIISFGILFLNSCKDKPERELKMIDEIDLIIDSTRTALNYDLIVLNNRKKRIQFEIESYKKFNKDTFTLEIGNQLQKYKEISKIYKQFISNYDKLYNEMKLIEKQSQTLRNSVEDHKLTKEEFKKYYYEERAKAKSNLDKAIRVSRFIHEVEPEFQRLNKQVSGMLIHLSKNDTTLKKILEYEYAND